MKKVLKHPIKVTFVMEQEDLDFFLALKPEEEKFLSGFLARLLHKIREIWEQDE